MIKGNLGINVTVTNPIIPMAGYLMARPLSGTAPLTVSFDAILSSGASSGAFLWDFGDGTHGNGGSSISHVYISAGIFTVTATVMGTDAIEHVLSGSMEVQ